MLSHPLLNALFDEKSSKPSKQLSLVRSLLYESVLLKPTILIILPPIEACEFAKDPQFFFHDYFLLSHVLHVPNYNQTEVLTTLNGSEWEVALSDLKVIPQKGFPDNGCTEANIKNAYLWSPGLPFLEHDATFFIVEIDSMMISNTASKNFGWFGNRKSTPAPEYIDGSLSLLPFALPSYSLPSSLASRMRSKSLERSHTEGEKSPSLKTLSSGRLRNPASDLGKSKQMRDQNMAKVDYSLACLQHDAISSSELAERFHRAVTSVRSTLIEAGGLYIESTEQDTAGEDNLEELSVPYSQIQSQNLGSAFTLASIYQYAEARLRGHLRRHLTHFLELERKGQPSFYEIHMQLRNLDLGQMDIPNIENLDVAAFERAVYDASLILGRLRNARDSSEMCNVFLAALTRLANRSLGMVSADTLLGLLMLTVLRVSDDTAEQLELDLHFVTNFSFQASDTVKMRASAGRVSYTLMVFQSVLMQLRNEQARLVTLAEANQSMWHAVRGDERDKIEAVAEASPTSLLSRRSGKSALFMAAEDQNHSLVKYLIENYGESFSPKFIMKDRDLQNRTLLMITVADDKTSEVILNALKSVDQSLLKHFFDSKDVQGRNLAHYLETSEFAAKIAPQLDWSSKDRHGLSPLISQARISLEHLCFFIEHCQDFHQHIDPEGNSLLHIAVMHNHLELAEKILKFPSCDVDWMNAKLMTPLMMAKSTEMSSLLLKYDADPWIGQINARFYPSVRTSRLANKGELPYVAFDKRDKLLVFEEAAGTKVVGRSSSDFVSLSSALQLLSTPSWVPPVLFTYSGSIDQGTFAYLFKYELVEIEMQRLSYWVRLLKSHPTLGEAKEVESFLKNSSPEYKTVDATNGDGEEYTERRSASDDATKGSLFGQENEGSIVAFLRLGIERLTEINVGLQNMSRSFYEVTRLQREDHNASLKVLPRLGGFSRTIKVHLGLSDFGAQLDTSLANRVFGAILGQTAFYAEDLSKKMASALLLADKLECWRRHLDQDRERMRALADGTLKVSWIGNIEEKRIREIGSLERAISRGRREIESLELDIRASHFYLANELGSFNQTQEDEILTQIKSYSKGQLVKSRDALKRLRYQCNKN